MESVAISTIEQTRAQEQHRIRRETEIERSWRKRESKFFTNDEIEKAKEQQLLVQVPRSDGNYRLIGRLGDEHGEPDLVRPDALQLLKEISSAWREKAGTEHKNKVLAVTSLYRGSELQQSIKAGSGGYLAVGCEESSHSAGAAFDISLRSYYINDGENMRGIQAWNEDGRFEPSVFTPLIGILDDLRLRGQANYVIENNINESGEALPSVLHVCASPSSSLAQAA